MKEINGKLLLLEFTCKRHTKDNIDNTQHVSQQKRIIQNMKMEKNHDKNSTNEQRTLK